MVLDGANRVTALEEMEFPHIVVQVVRYETPAVHLHTWYHGLTGDSRALLERELPALQGTEPRFVVWGEGTTDEMCVGILITS